MGKRKSQKLRKTPKNPPISKPVEVPPITKKKSPGNFQDEHRLDSDEDLNVLL